MSDAPTPPAATTPPAPKPAPKPVPMLARLDPAVLMIGLGFIVLVLALWWLLATPRSSEGGVAAARVDALERAVNARLDRLEARREAPDVAPLQSQLRQLAEAQAAADRRAGEQQQAADRRVQALEARPAPDLSGLAPRPAVDALSARTERLAERIEGQAARQQAGEAEQLRRIQDLARQIEERRAATEQAQAQRLATLEQEAGRRIAALEQGLSQRLAAIEQAQQRLEAIERRTARLAVVDAVSAALSAGQPLGAALGRMESPPPALARFAAAAPPTEAALRLSFEDAAKAGREASDAATRPDGSRPGVVDSALARLGGLVTVRRGEQVVWGDAAEAEIERARRALDAGDLDAAVARLEHLPPAARRAMQGWTDQAQALIAARAALRQLAAG